MKRRAFTLIELLVVIAIIGVLIGVLVPVFASALDTARGTLCLANQSQLMVGVHQYAIDNDGHIPYGPIESGGGELNGADDFYLINGMTTSLISSKTGDVVGAGLMLDLYLSATPDVFFCPGADQQIEPARQLENVGVRSAISGYTYRHGSNTFVEQFRFRASGEPMDTRTKLDNLGLNRQGTDIRALFVDNNFLVAPGSAFYEAFNRSNHETSFANVAFADGHAEQRDNSSGAYSADIVGVNLYNAIDKMLEVLEAADASY